MSKHTQVVELEVPAEQLLRLCQEIVDEFGWRVNEVSETGMTVKEPVMNLLSSTYPVRLDLEIKPRAGARSELSVYGSILGFGPIQRNHLKGQVGRFLNALSLRLDSARTHQSEAIPGRLITELRELAELHASGSLSSDEFEAVKTQLLSNLSPQGSRGS